MFNAYFEAALSILDSLDSEHPDAGVEAVHEEGPDGGPLGDALLLEVGPGPAHQPLLLLGNLLQTSLELCQVAEGGRTVSVRKQQVLSSENKWYETYSYSQHVWKQNFNQSRCIHHSLTYIKLY